MRWPWSQEPDCAPEVSDDAAEATQARVDAEAALERTKGRSEEIAAVAAASRTHRRVNHFAQLIEDTFGGRP